MLSIYRIPAYDLTSIKRCTMWAHLSVSNVYVYNTISRVIAIVISLQGYNDIILIPMISSITLSNYAGLVPPRYH